MFEWFKGKRYKYENTRQYLRIPVSWPVKLEAASAPAGNPQLASTKDVSAGGIKVETRQMVPVGSRIQVEVYVAPLQRAIAAQAQVVRCLMIKEGGFELGIRFLEIDAADRKTLGEAIEKSVPPRWRKSRNKSWWRKVI